MILNGNKKDHVIAALYVAIREQRKYEQTVLHYTKDSGAVQAWEQILNELELEEDAE